MSLEQFFGFDTGEGMNEGAFEAFKEKMKAAAAQIAAIKKEEGKQKKKEEELLKILLKFVKNSQKKDLVLLISRALEQNLPANFILAIIMLGNEEIEKELGMYLLLKGADESSENVDGGEDRSTVSQERALVFFREDETIPLKIRIELDIWMKSLLYQAEETPQKLIKNAYDVNMLENDEGVITESKNIKIILIQLVAHILKDFLEAKNIEAEYDYLSEFSKFIISGILKKTEENFTGRKLLEK